MIQAQETWIQSEILIFHRLATGNTFLATRSLRMFILLFTES